MASNDAEAALARAGPTPTEGGPIRILLGGDVMLGRGVDQILPFSCDPKIDEAWRGITDARTFVELAVRKNGPLPELRDAAYVWGDVIDEFAAARADLRLVNLETAVTTSPDALPRKDIRFRTHPGNVATLLAANIDCCALGNNHVLDWGYRGLAETIASLRRAGIRTTGAGLDQREAETPAVIDVPGKGRVAIFGIATWSGLTHPTWAAARNRPGLAYAHVSFFSVSPIAAMVRGARGDADLVIVSIHWGGNWDHTITRRMQRFAHRLIDEAGVDVIHGHSSHHVKGIEVYRGRLILYGCGDLIDDYEGIPLHAGPRGASRAALHARFRPELGLLYRATFNRSGALQSLAMTPTRIRGLRANRAGPEDVRYLETVLNREGRQFGTGAVVEDGILNLRW